MRKWVNRVTASWMLLVAMSWICASPALGQEAGDERIRKLETTVDRLTGEVDTLKSQRSREASGQTGGGLLPAISENLHVGGYGEMHANFTQGTEKDQFDIHRLVLYLGYDFSDWIKLHSETEIEHAFVTDGAGGEVVMEQVFVDFLLSEKTNIRVGRILTPVGIINQTHEPTLFNGVERPVFSNVIIPTTWSSDGGGVYGRICDAVTYEAYVVGGLDGSGITALKGLRDARIKERPSLNEPAFTGRIDINPLAKNPESQHQLRVGVSTFAGGLDNGNKGANPGIDGEVVLVAVDFEHSYKRLDFRGAIAHIDIDGARVIGGGAAEEMFGWYLEGACHVMPEGWKAGKLEKGDLVAFVRFDSVDTQYKMPSGIASDPAGDRTEWTIGVTFFPVSNFVVKADYQFTDDKSATNPPNRFNLGVGWAF